MVWQREVSATCVAAVEQRWLAPKTAKWSKMDHAAFAKAAGTELRAMASGALHGADAVGEADAKIVAAAEMVEENRRARAAKGCGDAQSQLGQWRWRLGVVLELVANPERLFKDGRLLHGRCGLRGVIRWARRVGASREETARALLRRCRREETFLVARLAAEAKAAKRWMDRLLRNEQVTDPGMRAKLAFQEMRTFGENEKIARVARKDDPEKGFFYTPAEVRKEVGSIGGTAQREYISDNPAPEGAFEAFAAHFLGRCEELKAPNGEEFCLKELLSFELFCDELYGYARHKAVGAKVKGAASSLELLRMLSKEHLEEYFKWVREAVVEGRLPDHWKVMVYTLLRKKHGDQRRIRKMREIALMDQTLKLILKCAKRLSFDRMVGRTAESNKGWVPGHGALDAALIADCILGQTRELRHDIYLLWLDLATFFPAIKRGPRKFAEWLLGLPDDVAALATEVFRGMVARIDTAHGLSEPYEILGGDLMGCVLSPNHARMILTAISVAVAAVSSGVKIWGCEKKARRVVDTMMADDWLGFNVTEKSLREQWRVWVDYALASGSPIGVAGLEKTVVAAATFKNGRWVNIPVRLEIPQGEGGMKGTPSAVPQLSVLQPYPHMGILRSICGSRKPFMAKLLKGAACLMGKVRRVRLDAAQHVTCANCLKGAFVGYYAAPAGLTRKEAERVEVCWRKAFSIVFRRPRDAPRVGLYGGSVGGVGESLHGRHVLVDAVASVQALCTKALAWPYDSEERAVARAALARRCRWWGCVGEPVEWLGSREHCELADTIEEALDTAGYCTEVFDYFILYEAWVAKRARDARTAAGLAGKQAGPIRVGVEFVHEDDEYGEALRGGTHSAWVNGTSPTLASMCSNRLTAAFINAGVTRVEHMCRLAPGGARVVSYNEARLGLGLRVSKGDRRAWEVVARVVNGALEEGLSITSKRCPLTARQLWDGAQTLGGRGGAGWAGGGENLVAIGGTRRLTAALQEARRGPGGASCQEAGRRARARAEVDWEALVRSDYPNVKKRSTAEWSCGAPSDEDRHGGVRLVSVWPGAGRRGVGGVGVQGGRNVPMPAECEVARVRRECERWTVGCDGLLQVDGRVASVQEAAGIPAVQLVARACEAVQAVGGVDNGTSVKALPAGVWKVHKEGTAKALRTMSGLQAEYGITHAAATDGGRQTLPGVGQEAERMAAAYGGVLHDGSVVRGALHPHKQGRNSYLTEVIALIMLFRRVPTRARVLVVVDARSPVQALLAFRLAHVCKRGEYYEDELIDELLAEVERMEVVVFMWAKSHVGVAPNEFADMVVTRALEDEVEWIGTRTCRHRSMRFRAERSVFREAAERMMGFVHDWLRGASVESIWRESGDWRLPYSDGQVSGEEKRVLRLAQQRRLLPADPSRHRGEVGGLLQGKDCSCGVGGACTTAHWFFHCKGRTAVEGRQLLCVEVKAAVRELEEDEKRHEQSRCLLRMLQGEGRGEGDENEATRWLVGCIKKPPHTGIAARRATLEVLKVAGASLLKAEALLRDEEELAVKWVKGRRLARRCGRKWWRLLVVQGPLRRMELAELWPGRCGVLMRSRSAKATADWDEAAAEWRAVRRLACWAAARRRGVGGVESAVGTAKLLARKVECCEELGLSLVGRARAVATARRNAQRDAAEKQAKAFGAMMGAPGQKGEPTLAEGLVDVEVTFVKRRRCNTTKGQRRRRSTGRRPARAKSRKGGERDEEDDTSGSDDGEGVEESESGGETDANEEDDEEPRLSRKRKAAEVNVGDELSVLWTTEGVWFGCKVQRRVLDEQGQWVHRVRYNVVGWPDCWHALDKERWRARGEGGDWAADAREQEYEGEAWLGELDDEAKAAADRAGGTEARVARANARDRRRQEEAGAPSAEQRRAADYERAAQLLDDMLRAGGADEVQERTYKRAAARAGLGWGAVKRVLVDADEEDIIMMRDGSVHLIGDLGELRERRRDGGGGSDDDNDGAL